MNRMSGKTPLQIKEGQLYFGGTRIAGRLTAPSASYSARIRDILFSVLPGHDKALLKERLRVGDVWPGGYEVKMRPMIREDKEILVVEVEMKDIQQFQRFMKERVAYLQDAVNMRERFIDMVVDLINGRFRQLQARPATDAEHTELLDKQGPALGEDQFFMVVVTARPG